MIDYKELKQVIYNLPNNQIILLGGHKKASGFENNMDIDNILKISKEYISNKVKHNGGKYVKK